MPRTPSIVLSRIGKRQKNAMNDDLLLVADPQQDDRDREQRRRRHRSPVLDVRHRPQARPAREADRNPQAPRRRRPRYRSRGRSVSGWGARASRTRRRATDPGTRRESSSGAGTSDRPRSPSIAARRRGSAIGTAISARSTRTRYVRGLTAAPPAERDASAGPGARRRPSHSGWPLPGTRSPAPARRPARSARTRSRSSASAPGRVCP